MVPFACFTFNKFDVCGVALICYIQLVIDYV